ncbi:mucin-12-like [Nematostella vectensis]|uniref:mucin-12-like n=1 Tax=Nematostella vectensis TaxID=45351 RepID=UPI002077377E|nr:mucin-12-like [Nematostella vectensis]
MVDRLIMDQIGEFLGNVLTSVNNNQQQRNDLSDADDNDVKRKKRKRSISRDLSSEMSHQSKTHANTHYLKKSPKGENQKTMLKIPVGGTLGALSSVRNLSQPSPAKRPRPSRSKANKINPASTTAGLIRVPGSLPGSIATVSGAPQLAQAIASQALIKGVNAGASSTPRSITLPNTSVGLVPQVHPTGQGFVSLAAKGAVKSEGGSQSYVAVSGTGSPSIVTTGTGSIQYVIKPVIKPQSHRYLPMPISVSPGTQSSQMATSSQATVISTASGGIRYTSLTQSPTSPFTSILNLKGNTTSTPGTPITIGASGSITGLAGGSLVRPSASIMSTVQGRRIVPGSMVTSSDGKTYLTTLPQHVTGVSQARMSPTSIVRTVSGSLSTSQAAAGGSQVQISGQKVFVTQAAASTGLVFSSGKPAQSVVTTRLLSGQVPSSGLTTSSVASQLQTKTNTVRTISRPSTATTVSMVRTLPGHLPGNVQFTMAKPGSPAQVSVPATVIAQIANSAKALAAQANAARSTAGQVPPSVQIGGRLSQSQTVNQRTGQVPASIQLTSPSTQGRTVSLNLPIRVAVTQGNVINRAPTSTLTTRTTTQLTAPVTQLLQGASTSAASTRPHLVVSRSGVLPHSVMIKGGSAVNMQSVLAGLPPGTRVIATTTADGNVLVVGPMHPTTTTRSKVETTSPAVAATTAQSSSVSKADRLSDASSKSVAGSATQQAQATPATPTTTAESSNK